MRGWHYIDDGTPEPFLKVRVSDGSGSYTIAFVDDTGSWQVEDRMLKVENFGEAKILIKSENIRFWRELH
jgi:hypothetical protein